MGHSDIAYCSMLLRKNSPSLIFHRKKHHSTTHSTPLSSSASFLDSGVYSDGIPHNRKQSLSSSTGAQTNGGAVGFLGVLTPNQKKNLNKKIEEKAIQRRKYICSEPPAVLAEFAKLLAAFPEFPEAMMAALVIREKGNCFFVCQELIEKGWGSKQSLQSFQKKTDPHLSTPYFHGLPPAHNEIENMFCRASIGTFITFYRQIEENQIVYCVCFKNKCRRIVEREITCPDVPPILMKKLRLNKYISPPNVNFSFIPGHTAKRTTL